MEKLWKLNLNLRKEDKKHGAVEPRKSSSEYTTLSMVVNRDWSDEVSKDQREEYV